MAPIRASLIPALPQVDVIEGRNLRNMEIFGSMSPYAIVWVNFHPNEKFTPVSHPPPPLALFS